MVLGNSKFIKLLILDPNDSKPSRDMLPTLTEDVLRANLTNSDALAAVTTAFEAISSGDVVMPPIMQLGFEEANGSTCVKSAAVKGANHFCVKIASGFYDNLKDHGISNGSGIMLLFSSQTGHPCSVIEDNGWLTDLRTAAAGALAAKLSCKDGDIMSVAVLGTGIQARMQLDAISEVVKIGGVKIWGRTKSKVDKIVKEVSDSGSCCFSVMAANTAQECIEGCKLIVTTTASTEPIVKWADLANGATIIAMGSDTVGKSEVAGEVLEKILSSGGKIICDKVDQCLKVGECQSVAKIPDILEKLLEFGDVVAGKKRGRDNDEQVVLVDLTGVGAQDACMASVAFEKCNK